MYRTDLAIESAQCANYGRAAKVIRRRFGKAAVTDVRVTKCDSRRMCCAPGRYITIEGEPREHAVSLLVQKALEQLVPRAGAVLAAGLGNPDIARDRLGPQTVRMLDCAGRIAAIETDVASKTGIETARIVKAVANEVKAVCVVAIDALACRDPLRIGKTVQISDTGLRPGSGVFANSPALSECFVGIPVIAVGVPMVSELYGITGNSAHRGFLAAPPNEDELTGQWAVVIAEAINSMR